VRAINVRLVINEKRTKKSAASRLDKMVAYYEKMLVDLEAHHLLDSKLVERDAVISSRQRSDRRPLAFAQRS